MNLDTPACDNLFSTRSPRKIYYCLSVFVLFLSIYIFHIYTTFTFFTISWYLNFCSLNWLKKLITWTFCYYFYYLPSFFQVVGNLKSSNRKLAFSWLQMSGLQTFQKFDKTALRCLLLYCIMLAFLNKIEVILILKCFISSSNIDLSRSKECVHPRQHFPKRYL